MFSFAVDRCAEKMCSWVLAGRVDVVVLRVFAHLCGGVAD